MLCVLSSNDYYYEGYLGCSVFCQVFITIMKDIQCARVFCLVMITIIKDIQDALCSVQN